MKIDKKIVADKLLAYFEGNLSLAQLVDWAENAMLYAEFPIAEIDDITDVLGQIGLADVRAFGLTWEDATAIMKKLGYRMKVQVALTV